MEIGRRGGEDSYSRIEVGPHKPPELLLLGSLVLTLFCNQISFGLVASVQSTIVEV